MEGNKTTMEQAIALFVQQKYREAGISEKEIGIVTDYCMSECGSEHDTEIYEQYFGETL